MLCRALAQDVRIIPFETDPVVNAHLYSHSEVILPASISSSGVNVGQTGDEIGKEDVEKPRQMLNVVNPDGLLESGIYQPPSRREVVFGTAVVLINWRIDFEVHIKVHMQTTGRYGYMIDDCVKSPLYALHKEPRFTCTTPHHQSMFYLMTVISIDESFSIPLALGFVQRRR